jgi:nucleotide-binding universal stress UspA family protein
MAGFNHILFPVDFSSTSAAVFPFVTSMAERFGAQITVLHAVEMIPVSYPPFGVRNPPATDSYTLQGEAERQMTEFVGAITRSNITTACPIGDPAFTVREYAEKNGVDLIMIPTHGHGVFRTRLLGSLTAKVLHDVECPVWTAAHTDAPYLEHTRCRTFVVAVDLSPESVNVLKRAADLAETMGAKLSVIHAAPQAVHGTMIGMVDTEFRNYMTKESMAELAKLQERAGTNLEAAVEGGEVSAVVRAAATAADADMVIIGRGKLHGALGRLRTDAYSIIRDSPCPVLSV